MRVLSIQQPWAWMIVNGHKPVENRDWPTKVRGDVLIHAGKKIDKEGLAYVRHDHPEIPLPKTFETGGIVGRVNITDCVRKHSHPLFFGPYGFVMADAEPLPFTPLRGQLGFFAVDPSILHGHAPEHVR